MKRFLMCAAVVGGLGFAVSAQAEDHAAGVKIGTLSCHEASGWGFVFGSSHDLRCIFSNGDRVQHYEGSISKFGVDIGYQKAGVLVWEVIAPNDRPEHGTLDGHYGGLTAGAAVGVTVSMAVPEHHKLEAFALAMPAAGCAIIAFGVVAYLLDDGDLKAVLAWVRRVVRLRS